MTQNISITHMEVYFLVNFPLEGSRFVGLFSEAKPSSHNENHTVMARCDRCEKRYNKAKWIEKNSPEWFNKLKYSFYLLIMNDKLVSNHKFIVQSKRYFQRLQLRRVFNFFYAALSVLSRCLVRRYLSRRTDCAHVRVERKTLRNWLN